MRPALRRFGLLATIGTVQCHLFETQFEPQGLTIATPESAVQTSQVMEAIYAVKHGEALERPRRLRRSLVRHLIPGNLPLESLFPFSHPID